MTIRASAIAIILALTAATLRAQHVIGTRDSLAARADSVFRAFDRSDAPGCALGVYRDGRIAYARGYGMANLELGVAITPLLEFERDNRGAVGAMLLQSGRVRNLRFVRRAGGATAAR